MGCHNTKGVQLLGLKLIYDCREAPGPRGSRNELIKGSSGIFNFKNLCNGRGRCIDFQLRGSGDVNATRIRKVQFEIIEVLRNNGYSVGKRERDILRDKHTRTTNEVENNG